MINVINLVSDIAFTIIFILLFYFSLKICFLREGKSKAVLFFLALLTNPYTIVWISLFIPAFIGGLIFGISYDGEGIILIGGFLYIFLIILFSCLVGRWLKAHNISLVLFLYLMFGVVCALSGDSAPGNNVDYVISVDAQTILQNVLYIAAVLLLYRFVVRDLSKLTDRKRQISWKIFLIPLITFLPVYYIFDYLTYRYGDGISDIVVRIYSMIVLALFLWAFTVIIRNINATNAAIEAQYEAEHDKLTGLYNKGKYIMLKEDHFGNPGSIALFNFDVNNLKYINDNYGHEYGDELIIKAAQSIHAVTSDNVFGFRMGGDEYAMVAVNITEKEAEEIHSRWEKTLAELNTQGDVFCVMACGIKYCKGEFDADELFHQADDQMYLDKKARKDRGETSYLRNLE
ncbi:diguanylate cyclase (GGDEF) domain-containing protein [Lachnospiraceae bacterium XBB2008]|nr:diguanylate cyclase (GGDEF) domain-containing protein [Lachnospiraceae bacterium XBB2008]